MVQPVRSARPNRQVFFAAISAPQHEFLSSSYTQATQWSRRLEPARHLSRRAAGLEFSAHVLSPLYQAAQPASSSFNRLARLRAAVKISASCAAFGLIAALAAAMRAFQP